MKKFLCLLLAAVLAGLLILPCAAAEPTDFTDRSTIRNYNAVRMLADLGLVAGYSDGSFGPDKLILREEVAKLMALLGALAGPLALPSIMFMGALLALTFVLISQHTPKTPLPFGPWLSISFFLHTLLPRITL